MNLYSHQSPIKVDGSLIIVALINAVFSENLEAHCQDLRKLIRNERFFFESFGKLSYAHVKGLSTLFFINENIKEIFIIEKIRFRDQGTGLSVNIENSQCNYYGFWEFKSDHDKQIWKNQLKLVQKSLDKPCVPLKIKTSPPATPKSTSYQKSMPSRSMLRLPLLSAAWLSFKKVEQGADDEDDLISITTPKSPNSLSLDFGNDADIFSDLKQIL